MDEAAELSSAERVYGRPDDLVLTGASPPRSGSGAADPTAAAYQGTVR